MFPQGQGPAHRPVRGSRQLCRLTQSGSPAKGPKARFPLWGFPWEKCSKCRWAPKWRGIKLGLQGTWVDKSQHLTWLCIFLLGMGEEAQGTGTSTYWMLRVSARPSSSIVTPPELPLTDHVTPSDAVPVPCSLHALACTLKPCLLLCLWPTSRCLQLGSALPSPAVLNTQMLRQTHRFFSLQPSVPSPHHHHPQLEELGSRGVCLLWLSRCLHCVSPFLLLCPSAM